MPNYNQPNVSEILDRAKIALDNENYQEAIRLTVKRLNSIQTMRAPTTIADSLT
ncbi:MAG: hypothetical protein LBP89_00765 [Helicobacteraceae bacterium]|nr:hypothetical protein [Helicobacteraceae bacterium]